MGLKNVILLFVCKVSYFVVRLFNLGSGSTWPGHIALKLNKNIIREIISSNKISVIIVAGTNGKTTTSSAIAYLLKQNKKRVIQNEEGANLLNGVASSLVKNCNSSGQLSYDYAVFEADENSLPQLLHELNPKVVVLLNLFRDQLDRYGEVNTIGLNWHKALLKLNLTAQIFVNADDPLIQYITEGLKSKTIYFGLEDSLMSKKGIPHDVDSVYCPKCKTKFDYKKMSYSHLGDYTCLHCGYKRKQIEFISGLRDQTQLYGLYNIYNFEAAILTVQKLLKISQPTLLKQLKQFNPAFGRQELIQLENKKIFLLLSKNPAGFNQSIEVAKELCARQKNPIMIILNDRIADGQDVSWIWDVEFEELLKCSTDIVITGDRTYDMALRMQYAFEDKPEVTESKKVVSVAHLNVTENLTEAVDVAINKTRVDQKLIILATYTGMLDVRKILTGRKLL